MEVIGNGLWRVTVIESERGWGQKIDHYRRFEDENTAKAWVCLFNSKNDEDTVPDWYMYAEFPQYIP